MDTELLLHDLWDLTSKTVREMGQLEHVSERRLRSGRIYGFSVDPILREHRPFTERVKGMAMRRARATRRI
jgi:hypothetical protein